MFLVNVLIAPGVELAGSFPAELQQELVFTAAVAADTKEADAAKAFIDLSENLPPRSVIKAKGMNLAKARNCDHRTGMTIPPRLATYSIDGSTRYGAVTDSGIVDLSARFGKGLSDLARSRSPPAR